MVVCYRYFCIPRPKRITFKQGNVYFVLRVTIRFEIVPKSPMTLSKGQSEFCVTNHNDLESSFGGLYDTCKHVLSLLLFSSGLRTRRLICHWFRYEIHLSNDIPFKWRLFPPTLILLLHFFHGAGQTIWLLWFQRVWGCRKQPSPYFQLLMKLHSCGFWTSKISFNTHLCFIMPVFWVKTFQTVEMLVDTSRPLGWILIGKGCFPLCNKLCLQQGPVGPRGPQGLQGKQVSASPRDLIGQSWRQSL